MCNYLAIDIGASSGRHIIGWMEQGELKNKEVYRFPNGVEEQVGHLVGIRISQYLAEEQGQPVTMNIWSGDGYKDIPADRMGPRMRYKEAIDEILSEPFDFKLVKPCVESKQRYCLKENNLIVTDLKEIEE